MVFLSTMEHCETSEEKYFDCLPRKLRCHLLPFQRDGVAFGIQRNGRYAHTRERSGKVRINVRVSQSQIRTSAFYSSPVHKRDSSGTNG